MLAMEHLSGMLEVENTRLLERYVLDEAENRLSRSYGSGEQFRQVSGEVILFTKYMLSSLMMAWTLLVKKYLVENIFVPREEQMENKRSTICTTVYQTPQAFFSARGTTVVGRSVEGKRNVVAP